MLDDQPPAGIEKTHVVIAESPCEYPVENTERVVNAQRIRGLAEPDSRDVKGGSPLDQYDFHTSPCERRRSRQPADTASDHQNASNVAHERPSALSFAYPIGVHGL